jgi:hypothetical protein
MANFSDEYTNIHYIYGHCDGNAQEAVEEYQRRFPEHRVPDWRVFSNVTRILEKVVKYQNVNDHYDAMSIWRTICSK